MDETLDCFSLPGEAKHASLFLPLLSPELLFGLAVKETGKGGGCPFGNWDSTLAKKSTSHTVRWISPFSGEFLAYNFQLRYFGQEMLSFPLARLSLILSN